MERVIEAIATGLGNAVAWMADSGVLFGVFAVIWIALGAAVLWGHGTVDQAWQAVRDLPLIVQVVMWVLFLPVMAGLWIWDTTWPLLVRVTLVGGLAGWSLLIFLPRALHGPKP